MKLSINKNRAYSIEYKYFIGFFCLIVLLLFIRAPEIILKGRFWGEEGTLYFKYAYNHNILETLFFVYFRCGYYYLSANLTVLMAALVPLEYAPFVSTSISFLITVLITYVIYFTPSYLLKNHFIKILFCLFLVVGPHVVAEVYCNAINTQVYWGILGVAALFFDYSENSWNQEDIARLIPNRKFIDFILIIACLSGLYCVILFPFFILKAFLLKDKNKREVKCMAIPFIFQAGCVIYSKFFAGLASSKMTLTSFNLDSIIYSLRHQLIRPLLGINAANNFEVSKLVILIIILLVIFFVNLYLNRDDKKLVIQQLTLMILYMYYFFYVQIGALSIIGAGGRYAFISGCIEYILLLLCIWGIYKKLSIKVTLLLSLMFIPLLAGAYDFQGRQNWIYLNYSEAPDWKHEVEEFEKDNSYKLKCWPYNKEWYIQLTDT